MLPHVAIWYIHMYTNSHDMLASLRTRHLPCSYMEPVGSSRPPALAKQRPTLVTPPGWHRRRHAACTPAAGSLDRGQLEGGPEALDLGPVDYTILTYTHTCTYIYIYMIHIYVYIYVYMYTYTYTYMYIYMYICTHINRVRTNRGA